MKLKTNYLNLIFRIVLFYGLIIFLLFFGYTIYKLESFSWIPFIFYVFLCAVILLIFKNGLKEPNFLKFTDQTISIKTFPYLSTKEIQLIDINGFSESTKTYYRDAAPGLNWQRPIKFPTYIIYLKDNSTFHLTSYNFKDFENAKGILKKKLKFLGKEKEEYRLGFIKRKLKYLEKNKN